MQKICSSDIFPFCLRLNTKEEYSVFSEINLGPIMVFIFNISINICREMSPRVLLVKETEFKTLGSLLNCSSYTTRESEDVSAELAP